MFSFLFFLHSAQIRSLTKVVYGKIGSPTFCPAFYSTGVHFWGELQHVVHVGQQNIKCQPIRTREIAGVRL